MISKEDTKDNKENKLLEMIEQSENLESSDFQALLSDEESAEEARMILEYRLAKFKASRHYDAEKEWDKFSQKIQTQEDTDYLPFLRKAFYAVASIAAIMIIVFVFVKFPVQENNMLAFESNDAPREIMIGGEEEQDMEPIQNVITERGIIVNSSKADFSKVQITQTDPETKTITTPRGKAMR